MGLRNPEIEAQIVAAQDEPAGYLVYADWLQGQGDPRGELVAVQYALETARGAAWTELKLRELELFSTHADALFGPVASLRNHWGKLAWRRGFVDRMDGEFVTDEGEQLLAHPSLALVRVVKGVELDRVRAVHPVLLAELEVTCRDVNATSGLRSLRHLRASYSMMADPSEQTATELAGLESLEIDNVELLRGLDPTGCFGLRVVRAGASHWGDAPDEDDDEDGRESLHAIFDFVAATPRGTLDLELYRLHGQQRFPGVARLLEPALGRRVRKLRLHDANASTLRALRTAVPELEVVELSGESESLPPTLFAELPAAPVKRLVLHEPLGPAAVTALLASPYLAMLERLAVVLGEGATRALASGQFPQLRALAIEWSARTPVPSELSRLADAMPQLEELAIDVDALPALADSKLGSQIRRLLLAADFHELRDANELAHAVAKLTALGELSFRLAGTVLDAHAIHTLGGLGIPITFDHA